MNAKRWIAIGIAAGLFLVSTIINVASTMLTTDFNKVFGELIAGPSSEFAEEVIEEGSILERIAVLEVEGVIQDSADVGSIFASPGYNHDLFMQQLDAVQEDDSVKGIVLKVNTPGGGVVESAQIHDKLVEIIKESKKPIYVSMGSTAASGGYYISAPATKIFASKETLTGSLGVIMESVNYGELAEKYGVEFVTIKSGPYKDIMSPSREMTQEERNILQDMIDNSYDGFVKVISEGRNIDEKRVREIADGRIYDGTQAKELKLIDDFGYMEDVIESLKKDQNLEGAQVFSYASNDPFSDFISMGAQKMMGKDLDTMVLTEILSRPNSPRLMYLYSE